MILQPNSSTSIAHETKRNYSEEFYNKDCRLLKGRYVNTLFYNCLFDDLRGLELIDCVLDGSRFITDTPQKMLGFSVTLNCHSFQNVELSPQVMNTLLLVLCKSKGNENARRTIINDVVGKATSAQILRKLSTLEN